MEDIQRARQEHQAAMRKLSSVLLTIGVTGFLFAGLAACAHDFISSLKVDPDAIVAVPVIIAVASFGFAGSCFYSGRPIPNQPYRAPAPFQLETDQQWRKPTHLRFLERLKEEAAQTEQEIQRAHTSALAAYESLPQAVSYPDYSSAKGSLDSNEAYKTTLLGHLPPMYKRIERIFGGDVDSEVLDIKEQIRKLQRQKQENERKLAELQTRADGQQAREHLHQDNHRIDVHIIELETHLQELEHFDFRHLWKELDLPGPPNLSRVPKEQIDKMKAKVETLNDIPSLKDRRPPPPQPSAEEERRQNEERREKERRQNKAKWEKKIAELKSEREQKKAGADSEEERRRYENFFNAEIRQAEEQWKKYL